MGLSRTKEPLVVGRMCLEINGVSSSFVEVLPDIFDHSRIYKKIAVVVNRG